MKYDVIIIGAGAAGLIAMKELLEAGYGVCLLEAAAVAGGRINTIKDNRFDGTAEAGAEFIHGKLPLTLQLLNEAGIHYREVSGRMISVQNGKWEEEETFHDHWGKFMQQLDRLKTDMSIRQFLDKYFGGEEYSQLRAGVAGFAEGFDLADTGKASILAVKKEWSQGMESQYRIDGGYGQLIDWLMNACNHTDGNIFFNSIAGCIEYDEESIKVYTNDNRIFEARRLIITVSAGVLQSGELKFLPELTNETVAIRQLGFGAVIKILLQFKTAFWEKRSAEIGFLLSNEEIPTWWTQLPAKSHLLTGWLGGPAALRKSSLSNKVLLKAALQSLSSIFGLSPDILLEQLAYHKIICWENEPYIKGGYSYITTGSAQAKSLLAKPVAKTIFFAGEALYEGDSQGTVEAALQSGKIAAGRVRSSLAI